MIPSAIVFTLVSFASSQTVTAGCENTQFDLCKSIASDYLLLTCQPLIALNQTWYNDCACLNAINLGYCYGTCTSPTANQEFEGIVAPKITDLCRIANIDPKAKPLPAPSWAKPIPVPTVTTPFPKQTGPAVKSGASLIQWANCGIILSMAVLMVVL